MQSARSAAEIAPAGADCTDSSVRAVPYRPDIDGLRALSVLAVIFFHAEVPGFTGGYVGVDVFFVISGYLITQLLMGRSERSLSGRLGEFYVRRCRRILPALIAMLLVSTAVACWLFLPGDLTRFGKYLTFTSGLISNLAVWRDGGYFDLDSPFSPLLHLWSIAVEEQFYLAFPLMFLASGRASNRGRVALIAGAALASFALCVWASYDHPKANFFLAPPRAWELLLGSLVALGLGRRLLVHPARDVLAAAALLALVACVTWYDDGMRYPGVYAAVPCVSAAVLIATATKSPSHVGRWLSARPLVFTGLISYSLYLWHLPVLAFAGYYHILPLDAAQLVVLLLFIYLLSAASWRYVEAPIRGRSLLGSDSRFLLAVGGATILIAVLGSTLWQSNGLPGRLDEADRRLIGPPHDRLRQDAIDCVRTLSAISAGSLCRYGPDAGAKASVVVWGDSHAIALFPAYERIALGRDLHLYPLVLAACRPLLDAASKTETPRRRQLCNDFNHVAVNAIDAIDPDLVILNAFWSYPDLDIAATAGSTVTHGAQPFQAAFERTLRAVGAGRRKVCVIGDVPTLRYPMPYAYAVARRRGADPTVNALPSAEAHLQRHELDRQFADLREGHPFMLVNLADALCAGPTCAIVNAEGESLYRDTNHLSVAGAYFVSPTLEACFADIG
jgi:peptidoglycan/LPS O-acetylase OafA/YrhL